MNQMIKILLLTCLLILTCEAQEEPFKQYPIPPENNCGGWSDSTLIRAGQWEDSDSVDAILPCLFSDGDTCKITLLSGIKWKTTRIKIYHNSNLIQEFHSDTIEFVSTHFAYEPIVVADFNKDNLLDIKISGGIWGNSFAGGYRIIYLLQDSSHHFTELSFFSKEKQEERYIDNTCVSVVTTGLNDIGGHNYFTYYLYKFVGNDFIDVSAKHGYPIFIQLLNRENHKPAKNIPKPVVREYLRAKPPEFIKDCGVVY